MEVGSPSRLTDRSEVFLPESSWRVSNLSAQFPGEAMPSRAPHALILTARHGAGLGRCRRPSFQDTSPGSPPGRLRPGWDEAVSNLPGRPSGRGCYDGLAARGGANTRLRASQFDSALRSRDLR